MADFPKVNKTVRLPVDIAVFPYLQDHRFEGKAVLPAVEAMRVLARVVNEFTPQTDITATQHTRFDKFLPIPPETKKIEGLCSITLFENGDIIAILQTKARIEKAAFFRVKEHVSAHYPRIKPGIATYLRTPQTFEESGCLTVSKDRIYRELVPFGPAYRNISENLTIHKDGAIGKLHAPRISDVIKEPEFMGSPFVLDAAFHIACVWGQRYCGVVAFPVGIEKHIIANPTQPGKTYIGTVAPVRTNMDGLIFDICIYDDDNNLCEIALGVHMRDVSAGRMKPPAWVMETY